MDSEEPSCKRGQVAKKPEWAGPHVEDYHVQVLPRGLCEEIDEMTTALELGEDVGIAQVLELRRRVAGHLYYTRPGPRGPGYRDRVIAKELREIDQMVRRAAARLGANRQMELLPLSQAA